MDGLDRLFRPRSIAVIGGGNWGANIIRNSRKIGFAGDIWPVHPSRDEMEGLPVHRAVGDLPSAPDVAFVGVNRLATIDVVKALSARGAGGAVCFASGFQEAEAETGDGSALQEELLTATGAMRLIGPNCYGFINYLDGAALWPDQHGGQRVERGVAVISQSSNIAMNMTMQRRGLPIAYMAAVGNQAQTSMAEMAEAMLSDDRVTALGLHIEGFRDLERFQALAAQAQEAGKPVVALKVGRSEKAKAATISHTASLAGGAVGSDALMARLGFAQTPNVATFVEALKLAHVNGPMRSGRIASISCSGGEAAMMADLVEETALSYPPLTDPQHESLRQTLGPKVALANPLDYHTYIWGDEAALTDVIGAVAAGDQAMSCIVLDHPRTDRCNPAEWVMVLNAAKGVQARTGAPIAVVGTLAETLPEEVALDLISAGITPFCGMGEAIEALNAAALVCDVDVSAQAPLLQPSPPASSHTLTEDDSKAELTACGLRIPRSELAASAEEAAAAAARVGFPVVLKGQGIAHKTEAGAVALGLESEEAVSAAARAMPTESFLVEEMVAEGVAELLLGIVLDPAHGYVLTVGAGGVLTELMRDSASLLVPSDEAAVRRALESLKLAPLLHGYRGKPATDLDAIIRAVMAMQTYVVQNHGRVEEVEVNPLICTSEDAIAADALIRRGDGHE